MAYRNVITTVALLLLSLAAFAQDSDSYKLNFYPDAWYNDVDGVRIGAFVLGEMEGTYLDGPHRLNVGVWLGTKFPDLPVSYYFSFTEPLLPESSPGNEANLQLQSSVRTGLSSHSFSINKRLQPGFDELTFKKFTFSVITERMFDLDYRPYPLLWSDDDWKTFLKFNFIWSRNFEVGRFNLAASYALFSFGDIEITQQIHLSNDFKIRLRGFMGYNDPQGRNEYMYGRSYRPAAEWLDKGISRAKGTIPSSLLDEGLIHFTGGANLRGYTEQDFKELATRLAPLNYNFVASLNAEFEFPNPVGRMLEGSIVEDFVSFRSYLFGDTGTFSNEYYGRHLLNDVSHQFSDAGVGFQFSINIPNYLGMDRGFALRYEIPFWLSHPQNEPRFKFRNLIGIGAVISL